MDVLLYGNSKRTLNAWRSPHMMVEPDADRNKVVDQVSGEAPAASEVDPPSLGTAEKAAKSQSPTKSLLWGSVELIAALLCGGIATDALEYSRASVHFRDRALVFAMLVAVPLGLHGLYQLVKGLVRFLRAPKAERSVSGSGLVVALVGFVTIGVASTLLFLVGTLVESAGGEGAARLLPPPLTMLIVGFITVQIAYPRWWRALILPGIYILFGASQPTIGSGAHIPTATLVMVSVFGLALGVLMGLARKRRRV
jgi:hypothetical protein